MAPANVLRNETTIDFKGKYVYRMCIKFNKWGDGFQTYDIFNDDYTLLFYSHNDPIPNNYLK